jgi:hypothetical protein
MASEDLWNCESCEAQFSIGQGVMGSPSDLELIENKEVNDLECSPFMDFVVLCTKCYEQKKQSK